MMSNSAWRNGGATLFLTTLTRARDADRFLAGFDRLDPADVQPHRGVELQRLAAGGGLGRAEHHADLHAQLVDEDDHGACDLLIAPESLRSAWLISRACRPGSESPMSPSISARGTSAATESITITSTASERTSVSADLKRLLAGVGLRDQQVVDVDAAARGVERVEARARHR